MTNGELGGTRLVLIRHGEAYCNVESTIGGHEGCRGLTPRGVAQAEVLAKRLSHTGELRDVVALWTSVLPRAIETAEVLLPSLPGCSIEQSCSLCERHPGEADGMSWQDYEKRYARVSLPGDDPYLPLSAGGESWVDFVARGKRALLDLTARYRSGAVCVVTHGGIIDTSLISFLGLPEYGTAVRLHPEHTSITEWRHTGTKWRLVRYNDAAHLSLPEHALLRSDTPPWVERDVGRDPQQV